MTHNHQASPEPEKPKFSEFLSHPEVRQRWEKVRKYFFLRESTYDMSNRCNLRCDWLDYVDTYRAVWVMGYPKGENLCRVPVSPPQA